MKNLPLIGFSVIVFNVVSCTNTKKETARQDVEVLTRYVDSVETLTPTVYTRTNLQEIEAGYNERIARLGAVMGTLDITEKERAEAVKAKFAALREGYEIKLKESEVDLLPNDEQKLTLRNKLFGEGRVDRNLSFDFVTAQNALTVYESFVNTIATNKDMYTKEEWDEIKILTDSLDAHKARIEKELPTADNLKIAELKVKLATIKASNRLESKANEEKKQ